MADKIVLPSKYLNDRFLVAMVLLSILLLSIVSTVHPRVPFSLANATPSHNSTSTDPEEPVNTNSTRINDIATQNDTNSIAKEGNENSTTSNQDAAPIADAGSDQAVHEGDVVFLDGSGSYGAAQELQYFWNQLDWWTVELNNATTFYPSFIAPQIGNSSSSTEAKSLVFQLVVNDGSAESEPDEVVITILSSKDETEELPLGNAAGAHNVNNTDDDRPGSRPTINQSSIVAINQNISGFEDTPIENITLTALIDGSNVSNLTATVAGEPMHGILSVVEELFVADSRQESSEPLLVVSYYPEPNFYGTDTFSFIVSDGNSSSTGTISIHVNPINDTPLANAGPDILIDVSAGAMGNSTGVQDAKVIILNGSNSIDPDDGDSLSYSWNQTEGPKLDIQVWNASTISLDLSRLSMISGNSSISKNIQEYSFELAVSDGILTSTPDRIVVAVILNATGINETSNIVKQLSNETDVYGLAEQEAANVTSTNLFLFEIGANIIEEDQIVASGFLTNSETLFGIGGQEITFAGAGAGGLPAATTDESGLFISFGVAPSSVGAWNISAQYAGNTDNAASISNVVTFSTIERVPPPSDDFDNPTRINTLPMFSTSINTTDATVADDDPNCFGTGPSLWYAFTAPREMHLISKIEFSDYNSTLSVYTGTGGSLTQIGCNNDHFFLDDQHEPTVGFKALANETYYFMLGSAENSDSGGGLASFMIREIVSDPGGVSNDDFFSAQLIDSIPFSHSIDTRNATTAFDDPQSCYGNTHSLWYSFTPDESMKVIVTANGSEQAKGIAIFTGFRQALVPIACQIDFSVLHSTKVIFDVVAGKTYYFMVGDDFITEGGNVDFSLQRVPFDDDFSRATIITALPFIHSIENAADHSEWYSFASTERLPIVATTDGSTYDTVLNVYGDPASGFAFVSNDDDSEGAQSTVAFNSQIDTTYFFRVDAQERGSGGNLTFSLLRYPEFGSVAVGGIGESPRNDKFDNATVAELLPFQDKVVTLPATKDFDDPEACSQYTQSVWYSFNSPNDANIVANTLLSDYATTLAVYSGSKDVLELIACNTEFFSGLGYSKINFTAQAGETYYFMVGTAASELASKLVFSIEEIITADNNDDFDNAIVVDSLPFSDDADTRFATSETDDPTSCGGTGSLWYSFIPDETTNLVAAGSNFESILSVYTGTRGSLSMVACNEFDPQQIVEFTANAGQTYYIVLAPPFFGSGTTITLHIYGDTNFCENINDEEILEKMLLPRSEATFSCELQTKLRDSERNLDPSLPDFISPVFPGINASGFDPSQIVSTGSEGVIAYIDSSTGEYEEIRMVESGDGSGVFLIDMPDHELQVTFAATGVPPTPNNGKLEFTPDTLGDDIIIAYVDADPANPALSTVVSDTRVPLSTSPGVLSIEPNEMTAVDGLGAQVLDKSPVKILDPDLNDNRHLRESYSVALTGTGDDGEYAFLGSDPDDPQLFNRLLGEYSTLSLEIRNQTQDFNNRVLITFRETSSNSGVFGISSILEEFGKTAEQCCDQRQMLAPHASDLQAIYDQAQLFDFIDGDTISMGYNDYMEDPKSESVDSFSVSGGVISLILWECKPNFYACTFIPGGGFTITPNPFTLEGSLFVEDDGPEDSDCFSDIDCVVGFQSQGRLTLVGTHFATYTILQTQVPDGYDKLYDNVILTATKSNNELRIEDIRSDLPLNKVLADRIVPPSPGLNGTQIEFYGENAVSGILSGLHAAPFLTSPDFINFEVIDIQFGIFDFTEQEKYRITVSYNEEELAGRNLDRLQLFQYNQTTGQFKSITNCDPRCEAFQIPPVVVGFTTQLGLLALGFDMEGSGPSLTPSTNSTLSIPAVSSRKTSLPHVEILTDEGLQELFDIAQPSLLFSKKTSSFSTAEELFTLYQIPTYPYPGENIASEISYFVPSFIIPYEDSKNNFLVTPIISKIFPGMTLLTKQTAYVESELARVQSVEVEFAIEANDVGFSFGISDKPPPGTPNPAFEVNALFLDIGHVGAVNFTDPKSFVKSPKIDILVDKALPKFDQLQDGCSDFELLYFDGSEWVVVKKLRNPIIDTETQCGFIVEPDHFSKFGIGGLAGQGTTLDFLVGHSGIRNAIVGTPIEVVGLPESTTESTVIDFDIPSPVSSESELVLTPDSASLDTGKDMMMMEDKPVLRISPIESLEDMINATISESSSLSIDGTNFVLGKDVYQLILPSNGTTGQDPNLTFSFGNASEVIPGSTDQSILENLRLLQYLDDNWVDITESINENNGTIAVSPFSSSPMIIASVDDGTFGDRYFDAHPLSRIEIDTLAFSTDSGESVYRTSDTIPISGTIKNLQRFDQELWFIVQVNDKNGVTIHNEWKIEMIQAGDQLLPSIQWTPGDSGEFEVKIFIWDSEGPVPLPLSQPMHSEIEIVPAA